MCTFFAYDKKSKQHAPSNRSDSGSVLFLLIIILKNKFPFNSGLNNMTIYVLWTMSFWMLDTNLKQPTK
jgi:hypothetical protein